MRNANVPAPLIEAVPKMLADVPSALQITAVTVNEWTLRSAAAPWSWYSSCPDGPLPNAFPPNVALSPFKAVRRPPPVILQPAVLVPVSHLLLAESRGCRPASASATIGFVAVFGVSVSRAASPGWTLTLMCCTALGVPSTIAVTEHEYVPTSVGAVIDSVKPMSTGAVNGPYGGAGAKLMLSGHPGGPTTRSTTSMCAAAAWMPAMICAESVAPPPPKTAEPPVALARSW